MNIGMIDVLVGSHTSDIRRQVASRQTARGRAPQHGAARGLASQRAAARGLALQRAAKTAARPTLRSRIGFALVEVGLHLQATAGHRPDGRMAPE
jgi:hypothetical protein